MNDRPAPALLRDARSFALEAYNVASSLAVNGSDDRRRDHFAIQYCLAVVGEALNATPKEIQALAPEIPWRAIYNLRNRLIHGYWLVDTHIVLEIAQTRTQPLATSIERLIEQIEQ
jgi:uncharacterized protein with HEPN domain